MSLERKPMMSYLLDEEDAFSTMSVYINNVDYILNPCDSCWSDNNGSEDICVENVNFSSKQNVIAPTPTNGNIPTIHDLPVVHGQNFITHVYIKGGVLSTALLTLKLGVMNAVFCSSQISVQSFCKRLDSQLKNTLHDNYNFYGLPSEGAKIDQKS